jgi:DNA-binding transcriptional LysR family regulator
MELGRLSAITEGMGVGIVPFQSAVEEIAEGRLVRWWIEGAQINSELGFAYLTGSYQSPVMKTFVKLCRTQFASINAELERRQQQHRRAATKRTTARKPKSRAAKR